MKKIVRVLLLSIFPFYAFTNYVSVIEWNKGKLTYDDFKAPPKSSKDVVKGEFVGHIKWSFNMTNDRIPKYKIYNNMSAKDSWLSVKHEGLLKEYQFMWDVQELYARKMRKASQKLTQQKEQDIEVYRKNFKKLFHQLQKERNKYNGVIIDQPDFYEILNKQYQDSLKMYDQYKLK